jgi:hypothetical protein
VNRSVVIVCADGFASDFLMTRSSIIHVIQVGRPAVTFTLALMLSACGRDKQ